MTLSFTIKKISEYVSIFKYANNSHRFPDHPQNKLIHCFTLPVHRYCSHLRMCPAVCPWAAPWHHAFTPHVHLGIHWHCIWPLGHNLAQGWQAGLLKPVASMLQDLAFFWVTLLSTGVAQRGCAWALSQHTGLGPTTFSSSGGMAVPPGTVTWAKRLPLCHIHFLPYPYHLGRARQPTVASSIAEENDTIWYRCHLYTIDTKDALASLTIEGAPGSTHLQSTTCLKAALATQIKSTTRLETH